MVELILHGAGLVQLRSVSEASSSSARPVRLPDLGRSQRWQLPVSLLQRDATSLDAHGVRLAVRSSSGQGEASVRLSNEKVSRRIRSRGWERLHIEGDALWRAYRILTTASSSPLSSASEEHVFIFRTVPSSSFMSSLPSDLSLAHLALPGTHESCALYGYPISQCQQPSTPCAQQLADGVRYLDVRLQVVRDRLEMYHGPQPQRSTWPLLLATIHAFLRSPQGQGETVIVCLKEENRPAHPSFASYVWRDMQEHEGMWYLEDRVPNLGEVRGKAVLLSRFDNWSFPKSAERNIREKTSGEWEGGLGIHPTIWPDSKIEGFEWTCHGRPFRIQDWYRVPSFLHIPEKFQALTSHLAPIVSSASDPLDPAHPFTLSYASASTFPLALPHVIAKGFGWPEWGLGVQGINTRLMRWLLGLVIEGKRVRACIPIDFYRQAAGEGNELAEVLIQMNFM